MAEFSPDSRPSFGHINWIEFVPIGRTGQSHGSHLSRQALGVDWRGRFVFVRDLPTGSSASARQGPSIWRLLGRIVLAKFFHRLDQRDHVFDGCFLQNSVTEIENMTWPADDRL